MAEKEKIQVQKITDTLELNFMPYAMSVIVSRAIPEIDGFKPSHRKLLYTMYKMGLLTGTRTKSSNVVGQTMKLNPHGDGAIYETMVRLTRGNEALLHPFVDSKGNFGKQYSRDMAYAAPRYTEVKLDAICNEIFRDIDKDTVEFVDNYDGEMKEPLFLPTTFPNILANPNQGIAVGMANSICSFNLKELCDATIAMIKNPNEDIKKYLKAPDFSTGAQLIYNENEINQIYNTGRGSFKLRSRYQYDAKNNCIEITQIPYTTSIEIIIDKIISLIKSGKIKDINDVRDETDLNGLRITLDVKKSTNIELLMHKLFSMTPLQDSFGCNFNILINGRPRVMGVCEIIDEWIKFRLNCIKRQIAFDIEKKSEKIHLLEGLAKILLDIDKAIKIIRDTEEDKAVIPNLMSGFSIDEVQADFIAEIKLRSLNKEYIIKRTSELDSLRQEIADLKDTLNNEHKIKEIICKQLKEIAKNYGKPRQTEIISEQAIIEVPDDYLIEDYGIKLFLTEHNYFKKISIASLRSASEQKLKDDDAMLQEIETTNKADVLLFSDKCNLYKLKAYELADCKASSMGEFLTNMLGLDNDEKILYMTTTLDYKGYMLFGFESGKLAKITLESYSTKVNRKKLVNAYGNKDKLLFIRHILEDGDLLAIRDMDKATLFSTELVAPKATKNSIGIQVMTLKKNSFVTSILPASSIEMDDIEYYRTTKIPSTGHFIREKDKEYLIK
jgi:DNA gyrase subunit A